MKSPDQIKAVIFDLSNVYSKYLAEGFNCNKILVTGTTANESDVFRIIKDQKPNILMYDLFGSTRGFDETINEINKVSPKTKVVVLSFEDDAEIIDFCMKKGVKGFFSKANFDSDLMIKGVRKVSNGQTVILTNKNVA